jgi:hypothetical protein
MMFMPANNACGLVHYLAGRHPGSLGWLIGPGGWREPRRWLPYALDNGRFAACREGREWDEAGFLDLLERARWCPIRPLWVAAPDEVGDWRATESLFHKWEGRLRAYGFPLAFVAQDGSEPDTVPRGADVVFLGGTYRWKWRNAARFCAAHPRVHVGRVNWVHKLEHCEAIGAESADGTGFFREGPDSERARQLERFVEGHRVGIQQKQFEFA